MSLAAVCALHPEAEGLTTCPRCGRFLCADCQSVEGFGKTAFCAACEYQPAVHELRLTRAQRLAALLVFAAAIFQAARVIFDDGLEHWQELAAVCSPFLLLAGAQYFNRHQWPSAIGALWVIVSWFLVFRWIQPRTVDFWISGLPLWAQCYGWGEIRKHREALARTCRGLAPESAPNRTGS